MDNKYYKIIGYGLIVLILICSFFGRFSGISYMYYTWIVFPLIIFILFFGRMKTLFYSQKKMLPIVFPLKPLHLLMRNSIKIFLIGVIMLAICLFFLGVKVAVIIGFILLSDLIVELIIPYSNKNSIIVNKVGILVPIYGILKWSNIENFCIDRDFLTLRIYIKDETDKVITLNTNIDIDKLDKELNKKVNVA